MIFYVWPSFLFSNLLCSFSNLLVLILDNNTNPEIRKKEIKYAKHTYFKWTLLFNSPIKYSISIHILLEELNFPQINFTLFIMKFLNHSKKSILIKLNISSPLLEMTLLEEKNYLIFVLKELILKKLYLIKIYMEDRF